MATDGVMPAGPTTDVEILRRLSLDLTGRIPPVEKVRSFVQSADPMKRSKLVDELISSEAYEDYWTTYFAERSEVTSEYYYFIGIPGHNLFYNYLRNFVERDRSYVGSGTTLMFREGNGTIHTIYESGDPTDDDDRFWAWQDFDVDLRGDGSLYFMGIDFADRKVIYHAQPLF